MYSLAVTINTNGQRFGSLRSLVAERQLERTERLQRTNLLVRGWRGARRPSRRAKVAAAVRSRSRTGLSSVPDELLVDLRVAEARATRRRRRCCERGPNVQLHCAADHLELVPRSCLHGTTLCS